MDHRFETPNYHPSITRTGAAKLADSQVAPLVAVARGVRSFGIDERETLLDTARRPRKGADARKVRNWLPSDEQDVLLLPWTSATNTKEGHLDPLGHATFFQVRPSQPIVNEQGKGAKYDTFAGATTPMDVHPATPQSWFADAPRTLITEGVIKGDSALTAMLLASGITYEELLLEDEPGDDHAEWAAQQAKRLHDLMERVPTSRRTLIVSIVGVANFEGYADWGAFRFNERTVYVAFDGDVHENRDVHRAATKMFRQIESKKGIPQLIDLGSGVVKQQQAKANVPVTEKVGLDDYLARNIGTWKDVLELATGQLPAEPEVDASHVGIVGAVRVGSDRVTIEKFVEKGGGSMWVKVDDLGGLVDEIITSRAPTPTEMATGIHEPEADADARRMVRMSLRWIDGSGNERTGRVTGPSQVLDTLPDRWSKMSGSQVSIDAALQSAPVWPPASGMDFLRAIKGSEPKLTNSWDCMGWVPTDSGQPAYLIGRDVLGPTKEVEQAVSTQVTEATFPGASHFGVIDRYWDFIDGEGVDAYRADTVAAIDDLVRWFVLEPHRDGVTTWDELAYGPIALAAMIRPCLPAPWHGGMYVYGPPGMGKSWYASFILGGWNRIPGRWSQNHLPGNAADTQYSMEIAIGRMPIWVSDDLAVSASESAANQKMDRLDSIIRQLHSGAARRAAGGTGVVRLDPPPRSTFILTGENALSIPSAAQRVVQVPFRKKITPLGEDLQQALRTDTFAPRATAAMIRWWMHPGNGGETWEQKIATQRAESGKLAGAIRSQLSAMFSIDPSKSKRQGDLYGDLLISLKYLRDLYLSAGGDPQGETARALSWEDAASRAWDVLPMIAKTMSDHADEAVGRRMLRGIRAALAAGDAHLLGTKGPGLPPYSDPKESSLNEALGWKFVRGEWVPSGKAIGYAGMQSNEMRAVFDRTNAFAVAARMGKSFISPGAAMSTSWQAAEEEGVVNPARRHFNHTAGRTQGPWLTVDSFMSIDDEAKVASASGLDEDGWDESVAQMAEAMA